MSLEQDATIPWKKKRIYWMVSGLKLYDTRRISNIWSLVVLKNICLWWEVEMMQWSWQCRTTWNSNLFPTALKWHQMKIHSYNSFRQTGPNGGIHDINEHIPSSPVEWLPPYFIDRYGQFILCTKRKEIESRPMQPVMFLRKGCHEKLKILSLDLSIFVIHIC